ncbi:MAG: PIG-L family deacetylase [Deltaproteobacteria bacterium]|nr:PIG-L family deacetylase [Deltaproteobacteria bacterium]
MNKCILVVSPHPDDLEIAMGGTVAKLIDQGMSASYRLLLPTEAGAQPLAVLKVTSWLY